MKQNFFLVNTYTEELYTIKIIYVMMAKKTSAWIVEYMDHPQVGIRSVWMFYSMHRVKFLFRLNNFLKKDEHFRGLILILDYNLIHNEFLGTSSDKNNLEGLRKKKRPIIWI